MAFRQPQQRPQALRHQPSLQHHDPAPPAAAAQQKKSPLEESRDWVLFAPPSHTDTTQTARTADLSRASYFGSLGTGIRSEVFESDDHASPHIAAAHDDDGTELDSLDEGLQDFQEPPSPAIDQSGTVLPAHNGLGAFQPALNANAPDVVQDQIWQHERYNPQRRQIHGRLSSVQRRLDALNNSTDSPEMDPQEERRLRVERWRTEQSKAVLEEIERETRRRYRRLNRVGGRSLETSHSRMTAPSVTTAHESISTDSTDSATKPETEGFWQRITRKVIRDLMGLDENTLSVIFGEDLPAELNATPTQDSPLSDIAGSETAGSVTDQTWEERLLARIARELGILVYQLSELESAFNTYNSRSVRPRPVQHHSSPTTKPLARPLPADLEDELVEIFRPTLNRSLPTSGPDASLWGIEEEPVDRTAQPLDPADWERHPSIVMIFNYLRNRFSQSNNPTPGPLPAEWATGGTASALGTSPESQRRADLIRRHHPLVSRATADQRRREAIRRHRTDLLASTLQQQRRQGSSSCASQSTRARSRRSSGTGQSRMYWDLGGSLNESSAVSSGHAAAVGGWGEV